jgi:hypothetical protein
MVKAQPMLVKSKPNVRFGSKADMCNAPAYVRFAPDSDRKSGHAAMVMPLKADIRSAQTHVSFGPKADINACR